MASADGTTLTLAPPSGDPLRLRFQPAGLGQPQGEASAEAIPSAWIVDGEVDWSEVASLGLLSAVFEDGRELAIATVRPRGAEGHDAETISSHLTEEGEHVEIAETLVSVEYDAAGLPRRLGVELWIDPGSPPLRVAADRAGEAASTGEDPRREVTPITLRLEGVAGAGLYEVLRGT